MRGVLIQWLIVSGSIIHRALLSLRRWTRNFCVTLSEFCLFTVLAKIMHKMAFVGENDKFLSFSSKCKERFSMNSLFASNIIYSFQIFALTLFLVIHTEFA